MLPPHTNRLIGLIAVIGLTAICVAACGGSNKPSKSSANAKGSLNVSFAAASADADKNSACMRKHGVPNFPDPQATDSNGQVRISVAINPTIASSPAFQSAQKICAHLLPGGGPKANNGPSAAQQRAQTEGELAFSGCMRKHGFPRFPDPNSQGQFSISAIKSAGINLQAPAVEPAALKCVSVSHGQVTKADVEQAIATDGASGSQSSAAQ